MTINIFSDNGIDRLNWKCSVENSLTGKSDWCGSHVRSELFCCDNNYNYYRSTHPCYAADFNAGNKGGSTDMYICVPARKKYFLN